MANWREMKASANSWQQLCSTAPGHLWQDDLTNTYRLVL
jgi:hypothetical protein